MRRMLMLLCAAGAAMLMGQSSASAQCAYGGGGGGYGYSVPSYGGYNTGYNTGYSAPRASISFGINTFPSRYTSYRSPGYSYGYGHRPATVYRQRTNFRSYRGRR